MKKNLRIVSAAATALLAVAPVAATAVVSAPTATVSAAENTTYDSKLGNLNQEPNSTNNSIWLGTVGYKNYTEVDAVKAAIEAQVKKQLAGNSGDIKLTWGPTGTVDLTKKSYGLSFKVSRTGVNKMKRNHAVKFNGKDSQYLTWTKSGNLVATAAADSDTPVEFDVTVNGNATESTPSTTTPVVTPSKPSSSASVNAGNGTTIFDNTAVNTTIALNAVAKKDGIRGSLNGNIAVTLNGKSYTALLMNDANGANTTVYYKDKSQASGWNSTKPADMVANRKYFAEFHDVRVNLGNDYANKDVTINLPTASWFGAHDAAANEQKRTKNVHVDENGVAKLDTITSQFYAYDATDARGINFFDINTGDVVKSGTVNLHAVNGQLNVESIYRAINAQYRAEQVIDNNLDKNVSLLDDIKAQLVKQNIPVGPNGYFKAQTPINLTVTAKSNTNGATATLPVTVNVDNVTPAASQETTKTVTIMHIAAIYDKNGVATHDPALRAYDTYSVVSEPVTINGAKFYKLAGKDQYIKVGNVDGTSRTLKHNSYVYKSTGKRANKKTLKKGSSVTTYGKSFMIAGHQMYRIGKNQYVKKANF